ncbi:polysaccharide deacetylase family protein [Blautia obeum]|uniref:polysaccharide deacetylase family protein n=1 Tax=Blautia TaxID=572511 RepID=UPI002ED317DE|nr:polysaccharide deacetylase family protein [Blautia obeum]
MLSYVSRFLRRLKNSFFLRFLLLMVTAFILGSMLGVFTGQIPRSQKTSSAAQSTGWGLSFQEEGKRPAGNASIDDLKQYNAYYASDTDQKIIYLTFDAGYENGNTPAILDALKKHQAPAVFFVVGNFIKDNPDLIRRILADDHIIGNHTMTHPDLPQISSMDAFQKELQDVEELYTSLTGEAMTKFYRPPRGIYNTENLSMAKELGYSTFFWSLAYVDWIQDQQPSREEAFQKLLTRIHPGAIVLLHNTSSTNAEILDELLTKWEEMGYEFHSLKELTGV